jgi:hypothetical protein
MSCSFAFPRDFTLIWMRLAESRQRTRASVDRLPFICLFT